MASWSAVTEESTATNFGSSYDVQLKTQLSQKEDADVTTAVMTLT